MATDKTSRYAKKFKEKSETKNLKPGPGVVSRKIASFWKDEVDHIDSAKQKFIKRGNEILKRFRDDRNRESGMYQRRMNLLWTNVKIMKPAIYNKCPKPIVDRKFSDKDPKGRLSSQILERNLVAQLEVNDYHDAISRAVLDYLLPGMGQVWVRYEPKIGTSDSLKPDTTTFDDLDTIEDEYDLDDREDDDEEDQLESTGEQILSEQAPVDYIDWKDFYMFPAKARTWSEVQAIGKKVFMSKHEAIERFGEEIGDALRPDTTPPGSANGRPNYMDTIILQDINKRDIVVYEIWNKTDRRVYWVSTGYDYLCDVMDDPLKLTKFFPCPKPLSATFTNDTVLPVADYTEWQDQALQIDELTQRIAMLTKACKIAGTYDASNAGLKRILEESTENQLIPVDSWANHAEKGGVKGSISFLPIKEIQEVINTLQEVRQMCKVDLDEITGLSDVLRGTTDSRETLGGLRLKNNNAGTRLQDRQEEVAAFACEVMKIIGEIAAKHFDDETLIEASGILFEEELQPEQIMSEYQTDLMFKLMNDPHAMQLIMNPPMPPPPPQQLLSPPSGQLQLPPPPGMPPNGSVPNMPPAPPGMPPEGAAPPGGPPPMQPPAPAPPPPDPQKMLMDFVQKQMEQIKPDELIHKKVQGAIDLLRKDIERGYRVDIETDSTIFSDKMQERADATEFITAVSDFMMRSSEMVAANPEAAPMLGKMLEFAVRKFRTGRDLESAIDEFVKKSVKMAKEAALNPKPDPEMQKLQAQTDNIKLQGDLAKQDDERRAAIEAARAKHDDDIKAANDTRDFQKSQAEDQRQAALDEQNQSLLERKNAMEVTRMDREAILKEKEHEMAMELLQTKHNAAMALAKAKPKPAKKAA